MCRRDHVRYCCRSLPADTPVGPIIAEREGGAAGLNPKVVHTTSGMAAGGAEGDYFGSQPGDAVVG